jgi:hypothetical protein
MMTGIPENGKMAYLLTNNEVTANQYLYPVNGMRH